MVVSVITGRLYYFELLKFKVKNYFDITVMIFLNLKHLKPVEFETKRF